MRIPAQQGLWGLVLVMPLLAQSAASKPSFDVISIKPSATGAVSPVPTTTGNRFTGILTLRTIVRWGYRPSSGGPAFYAPDQLIGLPGWGDTDFFDIEARAETAVPVEQMQLMVQSLLEERFQLKAHRETRDLPAYNLFVASGGPNRNNLKVSDDQTQVDQRPLRTDASIPRGRTNISTRPLDAGRMLGTFEGHAVSMSTLANALQRSFTDRPVIDRTDFKDQLFDFSVQAAFSVPEAPAAAGAQPVPAAATPIDFRAIFFKAVQEQLGLRLEAAKAATEIFVLDSIKKPSAN